MKNILLKTGLVAAVVLGADGLRLLTGGDLNIGFTTGSVIGVIIFFIVLCYLENKKTKKVEPIKKSKVWVDYNKDIKPCNNPIRTVDNLISEEMQIEITSDPREKTTESTLVFTIATIAFVIFGLLMAFNAAMQM